ncbi:hypothetical protein XELAEV_18014849mg [Xenopus laevis]|uniref:Uncharacterized protein n=1 Tax=Xenopus laevis TaxID=8355 RepID=A0A974DIU7_XENLA|nr:hypothetical protein XELAEV_18014849mg [Xenopus laevis]
MKDWRHFDETKNRIWNVSRTEFISDIGLACTHYCVFLSLRKVWLCMLEYKRGNKAGSGEKGFVQTCCILQENVPDSCCCGLPWFDLRFFDLVWNQPVCCQPRPFCQLLDFPLSIVSLTTGQAQKILGGVGEFCADHHPQAAQD